MKITFVVALVLFATVHTIAIPAPVKNAMAGVWGAVKPDVTALGSCLVKAAGAAAKAAVMGALPKSAANFLSMMGLRRLGIMGKIKGAVGGAACKALGGKALSMCNGAVDAAVAKGAGFLAGKVKQLKGKLGDAKNCLKTFGHSLCGKAKTKACGRRMIAIPAPVKNAMASVWAAVKPDVTALGACLVKAAGAAAKAAVMGALPKSAQAFLGMMGLRRLGILGALKGAAKKVGGMAKGAACKALGGKALSMCNSAVDGAVAKGAGFLAGKVAVLKGKLGAAKDCLKTFGHSLCGKAKTKACGRRLFAIPPPIKNAMAQVWAVVQPDLSAMGICLIRAAGTQARAAVMAAIPKSAANFLQMLGLRRLGVLDALRGAAQKVGNFVGGAACKAFGDKALEMCNTAVDNATDMGAKFLAGKVAVLQGKLGEAKECLKAFGHSLCGKAKTKACGRRRRMIAIPAPVKKAMNSVWGAVKADVTKLGSCLVKAAGAAAKSAVMGALPKSAGAFLGMMGLRRLGVISKIKGAVGGAACKALGGKALSMCNSAVDAGVKKGAAFLGGKVKQLKGKTAAVEGCLKALGHSLCGKAKTKACGRRF